MDVLKDNFWYVPNVLSKEELKFLNFYTQMRHTYNFSNFDDKQTKLGETAFYAYPAMETLLHFKTKIFEEVIKKELHPTYSFWRYYIKYSVLDSHKDRDSCELTATINLGGCGTEWPLHVEDKKIIIEALWDIIYSDEDADMYETNLMRRLSGLLYLDTKTVGDIKEKVRQKKI